MSSSVLLEECLKKLNKIYGKFMATQGLPVWGATSTISQDGYRVLLTDSSGQLLISAITSGVDVSDRWTRQLGEIDIERYLGSAIGLSNPLHDQIVVSGAVIDPRSIRALISSDVVTVYGSQAQALLQRATTYDLQVQLRTAGTEYDARQIRALTSADVVSVNNFANPLPTLVQYPSGTTIDPRAIRALTSSDVITVYGSQSQALLQRATTYDLIVQLRTAGTEYDARQIRTLTSSDTVTAQQTTRTSLTVKPEREDLTTYGESVTISTGGTPVQVIAASTGLKFKVYDFAIAHAVLNSLVYFYYGTSTTPTSRIFGSGQSSNITGAAFTLSKTLVDPRVSNASDALYLYASVAGTYYIDLGYVQE